MMQQSCNITNLDDATSSINIIQAITVIRPNSNKLRPTYKYYSEGMAETEKREEP